MTLRLERLSKKESFGYARYRPACDIARALAELIGRKTFDEGDLYLIRRMGFEIEFTERVENEKRRHA